MDDSDPTLRDATNARIISALDVASLDEALALVACLDGYVSKFKIGSQLFTRCGPTILEALAERDVEVFLDLKFHDIPHTVAGAVDSAAGFEAVSMLTVHAAGGAEMLRRAVAASRRPAGPATNIVAVCALTSLDAADLRGLGVAEPMDAWAGRLGQMAVDAGVDGLVCSAHEAAGFRQRLGADPLLITPGIRPAGAVDAHDDQTRVMTPADALDAGSDSLVIGRPIYQAENPCRAVQRIGASII